MGFLVRVGGGGYCLMCGGMYVWTWSRGGIGILIAVKFEGVIVIACVYLCVITAIVV